MMPNPSDSADELDLPQRSLAALTGVIDPPRPNPMPAPVTPPDAIASPPAATQETDVWSGGYAARAMAPGLLICAAATLAALFLLYPFLNRALPGQRTLAGFTVLGLTGAVWVFFVFCWLYRTITVHYRLTSRRLFHNRGCLYPEDEVTDLAQIVRVELVRHPLEMLCGVGRLRLVHESSAALPIVLGGIARPGQVANLIRQQILSAREANVSLDRVSGP